MSSWNMKLAQVKDLDPIIKEIHMVSVGEQYGELEVWFRKDYVLRICAKSTKMYTFAYSLFIYVAVIIITLSNNWIRGLRHVGYDTEWYNPCHLILH